MALRKVIDLMYNICCPMQLRDQILVKQNVSSHNEITLENDGDNSSNSYVMMDGNGHDKS